MLVVLKGTAGECFEGLGASINFKMMMLQF